VIWGDGGTGISVNMKVEEDSVEDEEGVEGLIGHLPVILCRA
jgi:hypothetical protein